MCTLGRRRCTRHRSDGTTCISRQSEQYLSHRSKKSPVRMAFQTWPRGRVELRSGGAKWTLSPAPPEDSPLPDVGYKLRWITPPVVSSAGLCLITSSSSSFSFYLSSWLLP